MAENKVTVIAISTAITISLGIIIGGVLYNAEQKRFQVRLMIENGYDPITAECSVEPPSNADGPKAAMCALAASRAGQRT